MSKTSTAKRIDDDSDAAPEAADLGRTPCDVKLVTDLQVGGGSFNRLTHAVNQSEIDDATGVIYFKFKGYDRRMSIHSAAVACVTDV